MSRSRFIPLVSFVLATSLCGGCVEFVQLLQGSDSDNSNQDQSPGSNDNHPGNESSNNNVDVPIVQLTISNAVPQLGDEVELRCSVVSGSSAGVTFAFQPDDRLIPEDESGAAIFIVEEGDVVFATEFEFTCTGTNENGAGPPSARRSFITTPKPDTEPEDEE